MKTKKKKYLPLYEKWMSIGEMTHVQWSPCSGTSGLCDAFCFDELFNLMYPTDEDLIQLNIEGLNTFCWASGYSDFRFRQFTPLRQTILLLMCALNDEL